MSVNDRLLEIGTAFDSYKESGGPPKADPDVYRPIIEHLREINVESIKIIERPIIPTDTPNAEQWNKILNYYDSIHDQVDRTKPDIEQLAELEIWFIKFIEPRPPRSRKMGLKMDLWKDRELAKYKLMVSDYCPSSYRGKISTYNIESSSLDAEWLHARVRKIEEMYRNTPQSILKKNQNGGVTRSVGASSMDGVVDLNKILGRK